MRKRIISWIIGELLSSKLFIDSIKEKCGCIQPKRKYNKRKNDKSNS